MKKKNFFRFACCLAACSMFAFSGCSKLLDTIFGEDSSEKSYAENEWNPNEDVSGTLSFDDGSETGGGSFVEPTPDPEKELLRAETDEIGHKIAYYTDGTCEDLGRTTPVDFTPVSPTEKEGYQYLAATEKGEDLCAFYQELYNVACLFHASTKDVTPTGEYYEIATMPFSQHGLTSDEAVSVWRTVSIEYPEFFWWGNSVLLSKTYLTVLVDPLYAQASARAQAQTAVENMVYDCDGYLDGTTGEVERALTIHDYVAKITTYAYESDYITPESEIWAHNIVGGALYRKGVCESYAKTYDYLCDLFGLPCITSTGYAVQDGESFGHAWNVVNIDGGWYNVDITWNDLDGQTLSREWFGTDPDTFAQTHDAFTPEDGWNVNFAFGLPTLDEDGLTPVRAANAAELADGKYTQDTAPMYGSIEDVCALIGEGTTYEAYLYPRTAATPESAQIVTTGATLDEVTHTTGTLVVVGSYVPYMGGYYEMATLSSPDPIRFQGDVVLRNVSYSANALRIADGKTLTTAGAAAEITVENTLIGGRIVDKTEEWTDVFAPTVRLQSITAEGTDLRFEDEAPTVDVQTVHIRKGVLRFGGAKSVTLGALYYAADGTSLQLENMTNTSNVRIETLGAENGVTLSRVAIAVAYTSKTTYPSLYVGEKTTTAELYLLTSSPQLTPQRLGLALVTLGDKCPFADLCVAYTWSFLTREISSGNLQQNADGSITVK